MREITRKMADEMLDASKQVANWQLEQQKQMQQQIVRGFEATQALTKLNNELAQSLGKAMVDAILPEKKAEA